MVVENHLRNGRRGLMERDLEGRIIEEDLGKLISVKIMRGNTQLCSNMDRTRRDYAE